MEYKQSNIDRREFIKMGAASAVALATVSNVLPVSGVNHQAYATQTTCNAKLIDRLLDLMENEIVPLTRVEVKKGNKIFGAGIIRKDDLATVVIGSNNETENPLWHAEVHTIKLLYEMPKSERPIRKMSFRKIKVIRTFPLNERISNPDKLSRSQRSEDPVLSGN